MKRTKKPKPAPPSLTHFKGQGVAAFDLSLASTGWATISGHGIQFGTLPQRDTGMTRFHSIQQQVRAKAASFHLVVMEGLSGGMTTGSTFERAGLAYTIRMRLWASGITSVIVPPMTLKKFTFGSGKAEKSQMLKAVYQRWGHDCQVDDEADACALLHFGLCLTGDEQPTQVQRECLNKVEVIMPEGGR